MMSNIDQTRNKLGQKATAQQRKAANPEKSIWVSASAGTGKTKVLSDRVLRLLLSGVDAGKILCLTYTKAAAVEMNSRVAKRLSEWAVMKENQLESELLNLFGYLPDNLKDMQTLTNQARRLFAVLLDTPGGIKIQTIHSFCQEILKRFPLEAKVSPYFEVMDDRSTAEVVKQIRSKLIAEIKSHPDSELAQAMAFLTQSFNEFKFPEVISAIIHNRGRINRIFDIYPNNQKLLNAQASRLGISPNDNHEAIMQDFIKQLPQTDLQIMADAFAQFGTSSEHISATKLRDCLVKFDFEQYKSIFLTAKEEPRSKPASKAVLSASPDFATNFASEAQRILDTIAKLKALRVFQSTKAIVLLAAELLKGYDNYKQQYAKMDYDDMILLTRRLLENKSVANWVLYKLDGGIDNILIDEAQDTSPDQWAIIRAISDEFFAGEGAKDKNRTIFAVGDRKQSIYSFQGADPDKFDEMQKYFASKTPNFEKINLEVSFRSTPAVLDIVDKIFSSSIIKNGVVTAGEEIIHSPFRQGEAGRVEFWDILEPETGENQDIWLPPVEHKRLPSTSSRMARQIALRIQESVIQGEILQSQGRPVQYSDYLILVRSRDAFAEELIRECKSLGVAISGIDRMKLLEQIAIQDLISLGKFLLLPEDDLSLAEVLKSPIFGLNDDDLLEICHNRSSSLWNSLKSKSKYHQIAENLTLLLNMADFVRPFELYSHVLNEMKGRYNYSQRMGLEAEDGLDEFINLTLTFEQMHIPSLQKFINWVMADDVEIKRELEQGQNNVVRLMTVHGSKGLQAPIVILPDTTRVPKCDKKAELLIDDEVFFYPALGQDYEKICTRLKDNQRLKMMEEYRRLMYVALTRAEDKMIFCGFQKSRKPSEESWYALVKTAVENFAGYDQEKKIWQYSSAQQIVPPIKKAAAKTMAEIKCDNWANTPAPVESPLSKPLTPSKPEDEEPAVLSPLTEDNSAKYYKRGSIIHKLLQYLPETRAVDKELLTISFIKNQAPELAETEVIKIKNEVIKLLNNPEFGMLFSENSKSEVPIMGMVDGKIISGQIDRLIVDKDRVMVVDFKTNRPAATSPAAIPEIYKKQMQAYKMLLQKIYPEKEIRTLILWTNNTTLMEVA